MPPDPVLVERVAPHPIRRAADRAVPLAPAGRHVRRRVAAIAVQIAPHVDGVVAGAAEPDGQVLQLVEAPVAAAREVVAEDAVVVRVLPAEVGGARGTADRVRDVAPPEGHALADPAADGSAASTRMSLTVWSSVMITTTFGRGGGRLGGRRLSAAAMATSPAAIRVMRPRMGESPGRVATGYCGPTRAAGPGSLRGGGGVPPAS